MLHYLAITSLVAYIVSALCFLFTVYKFNTVFSKYGRVLLIAAFILQTALIVPIVVNDSEILKSSEGYLFWFAWSGPLFYVIAGRHANFPLVGAFVAPLAAFFLSASSYISHRQEVHSPHAIGVHGAHSFLVMATHVIPILISELCLMFALVISSVYLIQARRIKKKDLSAITDPAPSLVNLESSNQACLLAGFLFMTLAIMTGAYWQASAGSGSFSRDPFEVLALIIWAITAFLLHARVNLSYSASRIAKLTAGLAFIVLIITVALIFLYGDKVHTYAS